MAKYEEEEIQTHIFIAQGKLRRWFHKIDATDAIIIAYIVNWKRSGNAETMYSKKGEYIWIGYTYLLQQLPILNIGYDVLRKRIRKLRKLQILRR